MHRPLLLPAVIALSVLALASCAERNEFAPPPPPPVTVANPVAQTVEPVSRYLGSLEAIETVEIRARVKGFLRERRFEPGDLVKKEQVLFLIEQEPFIAAVSAAEARLEQAEAAANLAQVTYERNEEAFKLGGTSELELRTRKAELDQARALVLEARAALDTARLDLQYTEVKSPIDGRVTEAFVDLGNLVGSGDSTLLAKVVDDSTIYAFFEIPELELLDYLKQTDTKRDNSKRGTVPATLILADGSTYPEQAWVDYVDPEVDRETGTVQLRATTTNKETLLFPGMFVRVQLLGDPEDALLVPDAAVQRDLAGPYLLTVAQDNTVERTPIEIGQVYNGLRACKSGITKDHRVIVKGIQRARVGAKVAPQQQSDAPPTQPQPTQQPAAEPGS